VFKGTVIALQALAEHEWITRLGLVARMEFGIKKFNKIRWYCGGIMFKDT